MKKIVVCCLFALLASPAFAQIYVRTNVGYSLPLASQYLGSEEEITNGPTGTTETYRGVYGSFGTGFSAHVGVGGSITKTGVFGWDVEFGYLIGKKYSINSFYNSGSVSSVDEQSMIANSFRLAPSLTFTTGEGTVQPFARIGPVLSMTTMKEEQYSGNDYYNNYYGYKYKYTGGISVGFKGSVGATFGVSESIQLFLELNFISLNYSPKKQTLTEYTVNGENRLEDIAPEDREVEFEKEVTDDEDEYAPQLRPTFPMSSLGLQFGAKFIF